MIFFKKLCVPTCGAARRFYGHSAAVYIHWPYCEKRCSYCNFNKYISKNVQNERIQRCYLKEIETLVNLSGITKVTSIYFGGGTPSLAKPEIIASIIEKVQQLVDVSHDMEITLEGNPTSLETRALKWFKDAAVNRLSIGVQALNEKDLHILGRNHSVEDALECVSEAKKLYPGRMSFDVIFGRPNQTVDSWRKELDEVITLLDNHVSLYQLILERGTALFKSVQNGELLLPSKDEMADMYIEAVEKLEANGFQRYEVANFSRQGAESKHNLSYWNMDEYIGIGPGAHSRFCARKNDESHRCSRIQTLVPDYWMAEVENKGHATRKIVPLSKLDLMKEYIAVGLRCTTGINDEVWKKFSPKHSLDEVFHGSEVFHKFKEMDLLKFNSNKNNMSATSNGLTVLDSILPDLILHLDIFFSSHEIS